MDDRILTDGTSSIRTQTDSSFQREAEVGERLRDGPDPRSVNVSRCKVDEVMIIV